MEINAVDPGLLQQPHYSKSDSDEYYTGHAACIRTHKCTHRQRTLVGLHTAIHTQTAQTICEAPCKKKGEKSPFGGLMSNYPN